MQDKEAAIKTCTCIRIARDQSTFTLLIPISLISDPYMHAALHYSLLCIKHHKQNQGHTTFSEPCRGLNMAAFTTLLAKG